MHRLGKKLILGPKMRGLVPGIDWKSSIVYRACSDFVERARKLLEQGGAKVTELETLIAQAEQFAWGPADVTADISDLHSRLKDAKQWVAQVDSHLC